LVTLLAVVIVIAVIGVRTWGSVGKVLAGGGLTEPVNGRYNIVLLGSDSASWRDGARIDSTTVVSVDAVTGRTLVIAIPRNLIEIPFPPTSPLQALYPSGFTCPNQIAAPCMLTMVYQLGLDHADLFPSSPDPGAQAMVEAVEGITGLTMNYYAFIDLDGFETLIDALGGIEMTIREPVPVGALDQTFYWIEPGTHHFTGEQALWYVRTRVDTDDYTRMQRQKCLMLAVLNELDPTTIATSFLTLADAAASTAHTNIPASQLPTLTSLATKATTWTISALNLTPPLIDPRRPDYPRIQSLVTASIAQVEALDSGTASPSSTLADLTVTCGL
jgi:LCP family protein required for cell wall assembly